jgi:hypothetical protein
MDRIRIHFQPGGKRAGRTLRGMSASIGEGAMASDVP